MAETPLVNINPKILNSFNVLDNYDNLEEVKKIILKMDQDNDTWIASLCPVLEIPAGTLIYHSNALSRQDIDNKVCNLTQNEGEYEMDFRDLYRCRGCKITEPIPTEKIGDKPRITELVYNANFYDINKKKCVCNFGRQQRMYGNFNFAGNYDIAIKTPMRGTQVFIARYPIKLLDMNFVSIELGFSPKRFTLKGNDYQIDFGRTDIFKKFCKDNKLDGLILLDPIDMQYNLDVDGEKSTNLSCYVFNKTLNNDIKEKNHEQLVEHQVRVCPEIVLVHNLGEKKTLNKDNYIGTDKLEIIGMIDLVDGMNKKLSREDISKLFNILFTNYLKIFKENHNGKQINIKYTETNIFKVIEFIGNNDKKYDLNIIDLIMSDISNNPNKGYVNYLDLLETPENIWFQHDLYYSQNFLPYLEDIFDKVVEMEHSQQKSKPPPKPPLNPELYSRINLRELNAYQNKSNEYKYLDGSQVTDYASDKLVDAIIKYKLEEKVKSFEANINIQNYSINLYIFHKIILTYNLFDFYKEKKDSDLQNDIIWDNFFDINEEALKNRLNFDENFENYISSNNNQYSGQINEIKKYFDNNSYKQLKEQIFKSCNKYFFNEVINNKYEDINITKIIENDIIETINSIKRKLQKLVKFAESPTLEQIKLYLDFFESQDGKPQTPRDIFLESQGNSIKYDIEHLLILDTYQSYKNESLNRYILYKIIFYSENLDFLKYFDEMSNPNGVIWNKFFDKHFLPNFPVNLFDKMYENYMKSNIKTYEEKVSVIKKLLPWKENFDSEFKKKVNKVVDFENYLNKKNIFHIIVKNRMNSINDHLKKHMESKIDNTIKYLLDELLEFNFLNDTSTLDQIKLTVNLFESQPENKSKIDNLKNLNTSEGHSNELLNRYILSKISLMYEEIDFYKSFINYKNNVFSTFTWGDNMIIWDDFYNSVKDNIKKKINSNFSSIEKKYLQSEDYKSKYAPQINSTNKDKFEKKMKEIFENIDDTFHKTQFDLVVKNPYSDVIYANYMKHVLDIVIGFFVCENVKEIKNQLENINNNLSTIILEYKESSDYKGTYEKEINSLFTDNLTNSADFWKKVKTILNDAIDNFYNDYIGLDVNQTYTNTELLNRIVDMAIGFFKNVKKIKNQLLNIYNNFSPIITEYKKSSDYNNKYERKINSLFTDNSTNSADFGKKVKTILQDVANNFNNDYFGLDVNKSYTNNDLINRILDKAIEFIECEHVKKIYNIKNQLENINNNLSENIQQYKESSDYKEKYEEKINSMFKESTNFEEKIKAILNDAIYNFNNDYFGLDVNKSYTNTELLNRIVSKAIGFFEKVENQLLNIYNNFLSIIPQYKESSDYKNNYEQEINSMFTRKLTNNTEFWEKVKTILQDVANNFNNDYFGLDVNKSYTDNDLINRILDKAIEFFKNKKKIKNQLENINNSLSEIIPQYQKSSDYKKYEQKINLVFRNFYIGEKVLIQNLQTILNKAIDNFNNDYFGLDVNKEYTDNDLINHIFVKAIEFFDNVKKIKAQSSNIYRNISSILTAYKKSSDYKNNYEQKIKLLFKDSLTDSHNFENKVNDFENIVKDTVLKISNVKEYYFNNDYFDLDVNKSHTDTELLNYVFDKTIKFILSERLRDIHHNFSSILTAYKKSSNYKNNYEQKIKLLFKDSLTDSTNFENKVKNFENEVDHTVLKIIKKFSKNEYYLDENTYTNIEMLNHVLDKTIEFFQKNNSSKKKYLKYKQKYLQLKEQMKKKLN